ncbi:hypothetical protein PHJA_002215300 [Phtheirospermum japonicum]|uniref:Uncharacterized protein n=1 Tax=Phtheirospermum japonicum TaxID=374723 RepID=A0A830CXV8_9LAMI|nr:hypothetical protein PHJA_002215300 [Phtheirospermum japonicum]
MEAAAVVVVISVVLIKIPYRSAHGNIKGTRVDTHRFGREFAKTPITLEKNKDVFPSTAGQIFKFLLDDGLTFTNEYVVSERILALW